MVNWIQTCACIFLLNDRVLPMIFLARYSLVLVVLVLFANKGTAFRLWFVAERPTSAKSSVLFLSPTEDPSQSASPARKDRLADEASTKASLVDGTSEVKNNERKSETVGNLGNAAKNGSLASNQGATSETRVGPTQKRKMNLMWCTPDFCKDVVREKVIGDHNQIILNGPATGQVAYSWNDDSPSGSLTNRSKKASVLLVVKQNDDTLIDIATEATSQLVSENIQVLLASDLLRKIELGDDINKQNVAVFHPPRIPTMGDNLPSDYELKAEEWMDDHCIVSPDVPFPDLVCTIGGDGLLMHVSLLFQGAVPPILSVAGGSLGFLTPFSRHEMVDAIRIALGVVNGAGSSTRSASSGPTTFPPNMSSYPYEPLIQAPYRLSKTPSFSFGWGEAICMSIRMRLDCRVVGRTGTVRARFNVLNEVVIDRGSSPYLAALECFCDDVHLTTVQADGIIFATPTGSTAYSMAAGGSVVHPAVPCILVTPICPHVLSFRSMVFPDHVVLRCYVPEDARAPASVAFDGKNRQVLDAGDSVQIQMSRYPVPTINRGDHSSDWLESLKSSFNFNTRPRQRPL